MTDIRLTTLLNGLRIITDTIHSVESVALGVWAGVGARHEDPVYNGAAHMVEHMLFKGTKTRSAEQISETIENVGGHMNAYTSREITSYHIHLLKDHAPLALDVLADMYQNSTLPDDEIERERHVILQEIGMCHDTPDDIVFDNYFEAAYRDQGAGAPILGTNEIISKMPKHALADHIARCYTPSRTVISAAGPIEHDQFVAMASAAFSDLPADQTFEEAAAKCTPSETRDERQLEQAHIVLGFESMSRTDEHYYSAQALAGILGGGMSSRLFREVREKRGLAYSVYAYNQVLKDTGQMCFYAGTGPKDVSELMPVLCDEILKVQHDLKDEEIARAKTQLKSNLLMARESMMTRADQHAKYLLQRDKVFDQDEVVKNIEAINRDSLQAAAKIIFSKKPTLSAVGPLASLMSYDDIAAKCAA